MKSYGNTWKAIKSAGVPQAYRRPLRPMKHHEKLWKAKKNIGNGRRASKIMENIWKAIKGYDKQWKFHNKPYKTAKTFEITVEPAHWPHKSYEKLLKAIKTMQSVIHPSYEMVWKAMRNNEKLWKQIESVRHIWNGMKSYENLWKSMEGSSWQSMDINGNCHNSLEVHGRPRKRVDIS